MKTLFSAFVFVAASYLIYQIPAVKEGAQQWLPDNKIKQTSVKLMDQVEHTIDQKLAEHLANKAQQTKLNKDDATDLNDALKQVSELTGKVKQLEAELTQIKTQDLVETQNEPEPKNESPELEVFESTAQDEQVAEAIEAQPLDQEAEQAKIEKQERIARKQALRALADRMQMTSLNALSN